jgi:hypothetical protein
MKVFVSLWLSLLTSVTVSWWISDADIVRKVYNATRFHIAILSQIEIVIWRRFIAETGVLIKGC